MFEHADTAMDPHPATLASRDGVQARRKIREVTTDRYEAVRTRIDDGLTWGVGGIVADSRGRLLLVREDGEWLAPGGEIEDGESLRSALVREVSEETGVTVTVESLVAVTEVAFENEDRTVAFYFAHYTATPTTTELATDPGLPDEEIEAVDWLATLPEETVDRDVLARHH